MKQQPPGEAPRPEQISLLPPDAAVFLHLVRENLRLLREFGLRYEVSWLAPAADGPERVIRGPRDVVDYFQAELSVLAQEQLRVVLLNTKNRVLGVSIVYQGGLSCTNVMSLADCFREAVRAGASSIILLHNHPSGDPSPSPEDVAITGEAGKAGTLLGIEVLDHVIVGRPSDAHPGYVSLRERGLYSLQSPTTPASYRDVPRNTPGAPGTSRSPAAPASP